MKQIAWILVLPALMGIALGGNNPNELLLEPLRPLDPLAGIAPVAAPEATPEKAPEACVIKTYGLTPSGRPDVGLNKPRQVIVVDPATGKGKIYKPNLFGEADTLAGPVGEVRRAASGSLEVFTYDRFGLLNLLYPEQVIDVEEKDASGKATGKVYGVGGFGLRTFDDPLGAVTLDCE